MHLDCRKIAENADWEATERAVAKIEEEIFADAFGYMNAFGAGADRFTETARSEVNETVGTENAAATEKKTGPPAETRWSTQEEVLALDGVDWMNDWSSIREQLNTHADEINKMDPVAVVEYAKGGVDDLDAIMLDAVSKIGGSKMKRGKVSFEFEDKAARVIRGHAKGSTELRAAAMASPYVAKFGKLISGHKNHEGHGTTTLTYAAPVFINGALVNEGVAIQFTSDGRPHAINVELQNGDTFKIDMTKAPEGTNSRVYRYDKGTALSKSGASKARITDTKEKSKGKTDFSMDEDTDADYMAAVDRGDTETAQRMVDEAAEKAGYTIKAYHGTPNKFNVFLKSRIGSTTDYGWFGRGFYFTTEKDVAKVYAGYLNDSNVIEAYLRVQNPFVFSEYPGGENMSAGEIMDSVLGKEYGRRGELTEEDKAQRSEDFTDWLRANGYDAAEIWSQIMILDSEQAKRTDPVTYDNDGNIIPLSQRFNPADMDIRWSEDEDVPQSAAEYRQRRNRVPQSCAEYAQMRQRELLEEKELPRLENKARTSAEARRALAEARRNNKEKEKPRKREMRIRGYGGEVGI